MIKYRRNKFANQKIREHKTITTVSPYAYEEVSNQNWRYSVESKNSAFNKSNNWKVESQREGYLALSRSLWKPILKPSRNWYMES